MQSDERQEKSIEIICEELKIKLDQIHMGYCTEFHYFRR